MRLDVFLNHRFEDLSRSHVQAAIKAGDISVNDKQSTKASQKLKTGDRVMGQMPAPIQSVPSLEPQNIPLHILYEDEDLLVLNKPTGLVVHAGAKHYDNTLVNALLYHYPPLAGLGHSEDRPGIVHRLDKDTSGIMVVAKSPVAYEGLLAQFKARTVKRLYQAIAFAPKIADSGTIESSYGRALRQRVKYTSRIESGKYAKTTFQVLQRFTNGNVWLECELHTGRTHQVRVHMAENGAPLLGDPLYSPAKVANSPCIQRVALHAYALGFNHPKTEESLYFTCPVAQDFKACLERLNPIIPKDTPR